MNEMKYIRQLEERIERLEKIINNIATGEGKDISLINCSVKDISVSEGCNLSFESCSIDSVFPNNMDDIEDRIDEIDDRLQSVTSQIEDAEK